MRREGCHLYICKEIHINCNILPSQRLKSDDSYVVCHCVDIKKTLTVTVWRERANSPNKYFHIHFPPLVSHVIHSYRCESINTNKTLTVMCFCLISQLFYCIIHASRCRFVNIPHLICLKHTEVLSNQK